MRGRRSRLLVELAEISRDDKLIRLAREHNRVLFEVEVLMRPDTLRSGIDTVLHTDTRLAM